MRETSPVRGGPAPLEFASRAIAIRNGRVDAAFFDRMSAEWRAEQDRSGSFLSH
jgi:ABC-type amino acid transport substrate-binding protein